MEKCNKVCISIVPACKLVKDEDDTIADDTTFKKIVGSLMYLLGKILDMTFSVCLVARYMERPPEMHVVAFKPRES